MNFCSFQVFLVFFPWITTYFGSFCVFLSYILDFFLPLIWRVGGGSMKSLHGAMYPKLPIIRQESWEFIPWVFSVHSKDPQRGNRSSSGNDTRHLPFDKQHRLEIEASTLRLEKPFPGFLCFAVIFSGKHPKLPHSTLSPTSSSARLPYPLVVTIFCFSIAYLLSIYFFHLGHRAVSCHLCISSR